MNAHKTTNAAEELMTIINANVVGAEARAAELAKITEATKAAEVTKKTLLKQNEIAKEETNRQVSALQAQLSAKLKNVDKEILTTYKETLIKLGVKNPDSYPLMTAVAGIEKIASEGLQVLGKAIKVTQNFFNYAKQQVKKGMK